MLTGNRSEMTPLARKILRAAEAAGLDIRPLPIPGGDTGFQIYPNAGSTHCMLSIRMRTPMSMKNRLTRVYDVRAGEKISAADALVWINA